MKKNVSRILTCALCISIVLSYAYLVYASTASDLQKDYQNQKQEQAEAKHAVESAQARQGEISVELTANQKEIQELDQSIAVQQVEVDTLTNQVDTLKKSIKTKENTIEAKESEMEKNIVLLEDRIAALYEHGDIKYLDVLLDSENLVDFLSKYYMINELLECDNELLTNLDRSKKIIEDEKMNLEIQKTDLEAKQREQDIKLKSLQAEQTKRAEKVAALSAEEQLQQQLIDENQEKINRLDSSLAAAWEAYQAALAEERSSGSGSGSGGTGAYFDGTFIWPCDNRIITSRMKWRWGRMHKGIDIGADYETVYASASGYAYNDYDYGGYGNYIMIFHGGDYVTLYGHLNTSYVSNGQYVSQGEPIAQSGNTGGSTGPHLHFEIRQASSIYDFFNRSPEDPLDYLPGGYTMWD